MNLRRDNLRWATLLAALVVVALFAAWFLEGTIPRHIVLASGLQDFREHAQRYKEILARDGVTIEERRTGGAKDNERLLRDPSSGVDVAFLQGGVVASGHHVDLVMLASLYYQPLWIFYRGPDTLTQIDQLRYRRVAIGSPGSGVRAFVEPLLVASNIRDGGSELEPLVNLGALRALQRGEIDAAFLMGPVQTPAVWQALHDPDLKLMSLARADAYPRRFPFVTRLTMPPGTVDFELGIPAKEVALIGTRVMLVARPGLSPAIINLLLDAGREIHGHQGYFEANDEFPNTAPVDLPVSADAIGHLRFGPGLLQRYLPFFVATYVERLVILLVPLLIVVVPLANVLPRLLAWRLHSRIYRRYHDLALLEHDIEARTGALPIDQWLAEADRIEKAAARARMPTRLASDAYTLREHIGLVRRSILAKAELSTPASSEMRPEDPPSVGREVPASQRSDVPL